MLNALAGDIADLQGRQGRGDLALDGAGNCADLAGDDAEILAMSGDLGGIIAQGSGDGRNSIGIALGNTGAKGGSELDLLVETVEMRGETVDLIGAGIDALQDLLGEAGEFGKAGTGNLHGHREGSEITHRLLHVGDVLAQLPAGMRQRDERLLAVFLGDGQRHQALHRGAEIGAGVARLLVVERRGDTLERVQQTVEDIHHREQHGAAFEETFLDLATSRFQGLADVPP